MYNIKIFKQTRAIEFVALIFILTLYIFLTGSDIRLPGINFDSANFGLHCYDIFKYKHIYLMLHPREGILDAYLVAPFFLFFNDPVAALRYGCIFISGLALFIFYFFIRDFLQSRVWAIVTLLLIATHPGFINAARGASWSNFNIFLPISIALLAFQKWYKSNSLVYFFTGIFFLGAALGTRIHSAWVINYLFICFFVLGFHRHFHSKKQFLAIILLAAVIFMLGAWNLVLYNISGDSVLSLQTNLSLSRCFATFKNIFFDIITNPVIPHYSFLGLFVGTFKNLFSVLNGHLLMNYTGYPYPGGLFSTYLFFISLGILFLQLLFHKEANPLSLKKIKFLLIMPPIIFLQSLITPQHYATYHFFILIPFAQLIIVATFAGISGLFKNMPIIKFSFLIIFLLVINQNMMSWHKTKLCYRKTGGGFHHSDAIYRLVDWLESNRELHPVDIDWGFGSCIRFLSKGQISPIDFDSQFDVFNINDYMKKKNDLPYFKKRWRDVFIDKSNIFLLYQASLDSNSKNYSLFLRLAHELGLEPKVIKIFYKRDRKPIYIVFRLE